MIMSTSHLRLHSYTSSASSSSPSSVSNSRSSSRSLSMNSEITLETPKTSTKTKVALFAADAIPGIAGGILAGVLNNGEDLPAIAISTFFGFALAGIISTLFQTIIMHKNAPRPKEVSFSKRLKSEYTASAFDNIKSVFGIVLAAMAGIYLSTLFGNDTDNSFTVNMTTASAQHSTEMVDSNDQSWEDILTKGSVVGFGTLATNLGALQAIKGIATGTLQLINRVKSCGKNPSIIKTPTYLQWSKKNLLEDVKKTWLLDGLAVVAGLVTPPQYQGSPEAIAAQIATVLTISILGTTLIHAFNSRAEERFTPADPVEITVIPTQDTQVIDISDIENQIGRIQNAPDKLTSVTIEIPAKPKSPTAPKPSLPQEEIQDIYEGATPDNSPTAISKKTSKIKRTDSTDIEIEINTPKAERYQTF